jgi:hypothetical protein
MNTLRLSFQSVEAPELTMVEYVSAMGEKRISLRGKSGNASSDYCSFQWTSAVKALTCLCLRASVLGVEKASINGEANSLASALDYALSKPPQWLIEMFGLDSRGEPFSKRLFKRINPERKRAGPVSINLNPNLFKDSGVEVFYAGGKLQDKNELKALYYSVLDSIKVKDDELGSQAEELDLEDSSFYQKIYEEEIRRSLLSAKVFSPNWTSSFVKKLTTDPLFLKVNNPHPDLLNVLTAKDCSSARLGIGDPSHLINICSSMPRIKVYTSLCGTGFIALNEYLKNVLNIPIDLHFYYPYGVEVVDQVRPLANEADYVICLSGLGPTAEFFSNPSKGYTPFMFGPTMSHRMVRRKGSDSAVKNGDYLFVSDNPTSAMFCFDALIREGKIDRNNIKIHHSEPEDSILSLNSNPDVKALLWFPHYEILSHLGGVEIIDQESEPYPQSTIIFANKTLIKNRYIFENIKLLYRHAWLQMIEDRSYMSQIGKIILSNKSFIRFINRCAGAHYLES